MRAKILFSEKRWALRKLSLWCVLAGGALWGMAGCGESFAWEQEYELPEAGWYWTDTLFFSFEIADTNRVYDMLLELEHTTDYGFQNLYVRIHTSLPDGTARTDLLSLEMADKQGRWLGDCSSKRCHLRIPVQQHIFFPLPGTYRLAIEQYTRRNPVEGIEAVALRLRDTGKVRRESAAAPAR